MIAKQKIIFLLLIFLFYLTLLLPNVTALEFNGTILYSNGTQANGTNITVTDIRYPYNIPTFSHSTLANENGYFNFSPPITDTDSYRISMIRYEGITSGAGTWSGPWLHGIYKNLVISQVSNNTFYLQSTVSINVGVVKDRQQQPPEVLTSATATVIDDALGTSIEAFENSTQQQVSSRPVLILKRARNYTLVLSPPPEGFSCPIADGWVCQTAAFGYRNLSIAPYSTFYGQQWVSTNSTTIVRGNLSTDVNTGNTSAMNFTSMYIFLHIPEANNVTMYDFPFLNATGNDTLRNGTNMTTGWFNISIGNNVRKEQSFIIMGVGNDSIGGWFAGFANVSTNYTKTIEPLNITMRKLAGNYSTTGNISASKTVFTIVNESNLTIGEVFRAQVNVLYGGLEMKWVTKSNTTGSFSIPLLADYPATVTIYHSAYTPKTFEITAEQVRDQAVINLSLAGTDPKTPEGDVLSNTNFEFYRSNTTCDVPNPPSGCSYGVSYASTSAYQAMRVPYGDNTSVRLSQSGVVVHFKQIDTSATAAPDAQFDTSSANSTTPGGAFEAAWRLGSLAPSASYDDVLVGIPYSDSDISDTGTITVNISKLYDTRWQKIWDTAINGTNPATKLPDYTDYNTTWFTGMTCDKVDTRINTTQSCYVNTTSNKVWLNIPHFSGIGVDISGSKAPSATATAISGGSSGGGAAATTATSSFWSTITANSLTSMEITKSELSLTNIEFTLADNAADVRLSVSEPSIQTVITLGAPSGTVYKYLEITASNIPSGTISSAKIKFKVEKSWLTTNSLDKDTVRLNRYADNQWSTLPTRLVSESTDYVNYEAETPGFSYFAISAEKLAEVVEEVIAPITEKPIFPIRPLKDNRIVFGAIFVVALLVIIALWGWESKVVGKRKRRKPQSKN